MQVTIHLLSKETLVAEFEGDYALVKWLGYLKEHGLANVQLVGSRSAILFRDAIAYIETDRAEPEIQLG